MKYARLAVMDSGVGGLSLLKDLVKEFPCCEFIYFGDNNHAPYGNRTERDLFSLTLDNLAYVLSFGVDVILFACNTLSVSVLEKLRNFSPVKIFGIYPPVEKEVVEGKKVLLLATDVTANKYLAVKNVIALGLSALVREIENNLSRVDSVKIGRFLPNKKFFFDTLILGCTHFNFVKNQIFNHFCPLKITSGADATIDNVKKFLCYQKSLENTSQNNVLFIGENKKINSYFWGKILAQK